jgi:hypothetical protein
MKPSRWGVEHTFVDSSAFRVLSHEFDGAFKLRGRSIQKVQVARCPEQELLVNVDIDNVWKAFPWDKFLEDGRHRIYPLFRITLRLRGVVDFGDA